MTPVGVKSAGACISRADAVMPRKYPPGSKADKGTVARRGDPGGVEVVTNSGRTAVDAALDEPDRRR